MEPHLICVVTLGLCRCGFVSNTEMSGGSVCPHCCHETAVTANGGEGELYRKLVKHLLQVRLQHCSLISNHPFFNCMGFFYFLQSPSSVTPFPPTSREQGRALCQAASHPTFPAQPLLQPVLERTYKSSGPRQILLSQTLPPAPTDMHSHPAGPTVEACLFAAGFLKGKGEKQRQLIAPAIRQHA